MAELDIGDLPAPAPSFDLGDLPEPPPKAARAKPAETEGGAFVGYPSTGMGRKAGYATGALEGALGIPPKQSVGALTTTPYAAGYQKGEEYSTPVEIAGLAVPAYGAAKGAYAVAKPVVKGAASALGFPLKSAVKEFRAGTSPEILSGIESRTQDIIKQEALRGKAQRGLVSTAEQEILKAQEESKGALNKIAKPTNESTLGGEMRNFFEPNLAGIKEARGKQYENMMKPVMSAAKKNESSGLYWSNSETGKAFLADIERSLKPENMLSLTREERNILMNTRDRLSPIKVKEGLARVPIEGVDKEIRRLRDLSSGPPKEGVDAITQQFAGKLADKLADSVFGSVTEAGEVVKGFAPGGRMAKQVYRDMSVPVNQYKSSLGQQLTARFPEAPEFFMAGESTIPSTAFRDRESARQLIALSTGKTKKVEEFAAKHTANELQGKTAAQAQDWLNTKGAYLEEFPTVKKFAQDYVDTLTRNEAKITGQEAITKQVGKDVTTTRARSLKSQKDIADIKDRLQKTLTEAEPAQLRERVEKILPELRQYGVFTAEQEQRFIAELDNIKNIADKRARDRKIAYIVGAIGLTYPAQRVLNKLTSFPIGQ